MTESDRLRGRTYRQGRSVGQAAISGARWLPAAQVVNQGARIVLTFVLAWFLTRAEFGLVAVATVAMALVDTLADLGTGQAVIQRRELDDRMADAIFALNTTIGLALGGAIIVFADPITWFVGGSEAADAAPLMQILGINVIVKSAGVVQYALLRRRMQFRKAGLTQIISAGSYFVVTIVMAFAGTGPWSIVIGTTVGSVISVVLAWVWSGWLPRWRFDLAAIREVSGFSLSLTATGLFNYATQNVDRSLISHHIGVGPLGVYTLGTRILRAPIVMLTSTLNQVLVPTLARLQDDLAAQRRRFLQATSATAIVVFPAMLGLSVLADPIVDAVLPARWADAAWLITWMAPIGMMRALWGLVSPVYVANGRTGQQLIWSIFFGSMLIGSFFVTAPMGLTAVVVGIAAVHLVAMPLFFHFPFAIIELRFRTYIAALAPVSAVAAVMTAAVLSARLGLEAAGWTSLPIVLTCVPLGVSVYVGLMALIRPPGLEEVLRVVGARVPSGRAQGAAVSGTP